MQHESNKIGSNSDFKILIVDDDKIVLDLLSEFFKRERFQTDKAINGNEALKKFVEGEFDFVFLDLKLPDMSGLDVLEKLKKIDEQVSVVIITGYGTIETAVKAMKIGADDYILKPFKGLKELALTINKLRENKELRDENRYLKEQLGQYYDLGNIIGKSKKMAQMFQLIKKVSPLNSNVLIEGESGTGKELVAHAIHQNSKRKNNRFVAINCGALPEDLLESELFGHEKGSFTGAIKTKKGYFEVADGGTIFLDEVSEMHVALQVKLLRVLQEKKFQRIGGTDEISSDVRIITSTNRNLQEEVKKGSFRMDLYYRINVVKISVPPLRERKDDIPLLVQYFLNKYSKEFNKKIEFILPSVIEVLMNKKWEGNVRELENTVEHAVAVADKNKITLKELPSSIVNVGFSVEQQIQDLPFAEAKNIFEKNYLEKMLKSAKGNITKASCLTKIPRQNIYEKIKKYNIKIDAYR